MDQIFSLKNLKISKIQKKKEKIIGKLFIQIFENEAKKLKM